MEIKEPPKEIVVGKYKKTREVLPNGLTKETREEKTITLRREPPPPNERE